MKKKLIPHKEYRKRVLRNVLFSTALLCFSLAIGMAGYMFFFKINWIDSLLNASMILTGMGPVNAAPTNGAKLFASFYAIYSGVAFLTSVAMVFAPVFHRFLHKFHLDLDED